MNDVRRRSAHFSELARRLTGLFGELVGSLCASDPFQAQIDLLRDVLFLSACAGMDRRGVQDTVQARMFGIAPSSYYERRGRARERLDRARVAHSDFLQRADAVLRFLPPATPKGRAMTFDELATRFVHAEDDPASVRRGPNFRPDELRSLLLQLTDAGLASTRTLGKRKHYARLRDIDMSRPGVYDVGVTLFREGPLTLPELAGRLFLLDEECLEHLEELRRRGLLRENVASGGQVAYGIRELHFRPGEPETAEAGIYDHFAVICRLMGDRAYRAGRPAPEPDSPVRDTDGGSTYSFVVERGSPVASELREFLEATRAQLDAYSDATRRVEPPEDGRGDWEEVTIYVGQRSNPIETSSRPHVRP